MIVYTDEIENRRLNVPRQTTVQFRNAHVVRVDVSGQSIDNFLATGSLFEDCDFRGSVWTGGVLGDLPLVTFRGCDFDEADLRGINPQFARFEDCSFTNALLDDWPAICAEFVHCTFAGRLLRVKFSGRPLGIGRARVERERSVNAFVDNDFRAADLVDCSIVGGIDLNANLWPEKPDYLVIKSAGARIAAAKQKMARMPADSINKPEAEAVLRVYSMMGFQFQHDLLVRKSELGAVAELLMDP